MSSSVSQGQPTTSDWPDSPSNTMAAKNPPIGGGGAVFPYVWSPGLWGNLKGRTRGDFKCCKRILEAFIYEHCHLLAIYFFKFLMVYVHIWRSIIVFWFLCHCDTQFVVVFYSRGTCCYVLFQVMIYSRCMGIERMIETLDKIDLFVLSIYILYMHTSLLGLWLWLWLTMAEAARLVLSSFCLCRWHQFDIILRCL